MGTKTSNRRRRAKPRGLATFVAFLLLFAFAIGQSSLTALADDAGTDPVAEETASDDGGRGSLPEATPEEEAPAEETPADEPAEEEAPPAEEPAEEPAADDGGAASSGGGKASASSDESSSGATGKRDRLNVAQAGDDAVIQSHGGLHGGDIDLDYVAAGPFTYDHATGVGPNPPFGYNSRTLNKNTGVVESLESGDFACGDLVSFFTEIEVADDADGGGTIELDYTFGAETTGQPGLGFDDIVAVEVNADDDALVDPDNNAVATLIAEGFDDSGYNQVTGTVEIEGLDPGDVIIVRLTAELTCIPGETPTGNILNAIESGRVSSSDDDTIPVGQQTVPMKTTGFVGVPAIDIEKFCPATAVEGEEITFDITITNTGNEDLENMVVTDTVNGHATVPVPGAPTELAAGDSVLLEFTYTVQAGDPDPLTNTVTVEADGVFSQETVTDTDECTTDLEQNPAIDVDKTCPGAAQVGDTISYTITVTNTGDETLENVTVDDTLLGDLSASFDDVFSPGETESHDFDYTIQEGDPDPLPNTVTAEGTGVTSNETVDDVASCDTDLLNPEILVTKSCTEFAQVGDTITYTITVSNEGDEDLENITVEDTLLGDLSSSFADTLDVGESESHDFDYVVQEGDPDPLPNTVTATGSGVTSEEVVESTASCETEILNPAIDVTKSCPQFGQVGDTITYTITVTNTGDEDLENVEVVDTLLGDLSDSFADTLAAGDSESHDFDYTIQAGDPDPLPNEVTATATGVTSEAEVEDSAECETDVLNPSIDVTKECTPVAHVGDTVTYTITVTNTGDTGLANVTVMDTVLGDLSDSFDDVFSPGETESHDFSYVVQEGDPDPLVNVVTASGNVVVGEGVSEDVVEDTAECVTDLLNPAIDIVKTVSEDTVPVGTTVTYTYVITNTGDTTLYDVSVDDDIMGHIGDIPVLEPGQSVTMTKDFVVGEDPVVNVATAEGEDILGRSVSASDDAEVTPILAETPPPPTPFTGSDAARLGIIAMVLFGIGATLVAATRRRRARETA